MDIVIRAAIIFFFVYFVIRALGKRELGELSAFELVLLLIIGDLVQQSITQGDTSLTAAILAISTITLLILAESYVALRGKRARSLLEGVPVVIVLEGEVVKRAIHDQRMSVDDLHEAARAQGIGDLHDVQVAILENDGTIAFVKYDRGAPPPSQHKPA